MAYIDIDDIVIPEAYVAVPTIQALSYSMDKEDLRNLYANLLASSMNKNKKDAVHPSFVEIIKQLTPDEAKLINEIANIGSFPIISIRRFEKDSKGGFDILENYAKFGEKVCLEFPDRIEEYLENLDRLKIINIPEDSYLTAPNIYHELENDEEIIKLMQTELDKFNYKIKKKLGKITNFGLSFIISCCDQVITEEINL